MSKKKKYFTDVFKFISCDKKYTIEFTNKNKTIDPRDLTLDYTVTMFKEQKGVLSKVCIFQNLVLDKTTFERSEESKNEWVLPVDTHFSYKKRNYNIHALFKYIYPNQFMLIKTGNPDEFKFELTLYENYKRE